MTVTLRDIVLSVRYGDAALAGESAGYLVLGAADLALRKAQFATVDSVSVNPQGSVELRGTACSEDDAEDSLRLLLGQLLEHVRASCLNLERISTRPERRGLSGLVQELEAALIPVNRRAGARTHARLVREAARSAAQERHFAQVQPVQRSVATTDPLVTPALPAELETEEGWTTPGDHPTPVIATRDSILSESSLQAGSGPRTLSLESPGRRMNPRDVIVSSRELPPSKTARLHLSAASRPVILASVAEAYAPSRADTPVPETARIEPLEPEYFAEDELDEAPTTVFEGRLEEVRPFEVRATAGALQIVPENSVAICFPEISVPLEPPAPLPIRRIVLGPAPLPVPENTAKARLARRVPPKIRFLHAVRRPKDPIPAEVSLVPLDRRAPERRPSDIAQLLDRMKIEEGSSDELYAGLQSLARIDHSPFAPAVVETARLDAS